MRPRYELVRAPGTVTHTGREYFYYWDIAPNLPLYARIPRHATFSYRLADGDTPEAALAALRECGRNPEERMR